ncbi:MAG TPA: lipid A export permease/ATP-binding protein MsbA [Gammaproteobacteria bacterium]|nr:lipid A export permease/ATP-binding protein MsbA [Gammaproteobacteria bacterium]
MSKQPLDTRSLAIYRRLLGYVRPYWKLFTLAMVGMIVYAFTQPAFAYLMKPLLDGSFVHHDPEAIRAVPLAIVGIFILRGVAAFLSKFYINWVGRRVIKSLRADVFHKFLTLPTAYYDRSAAGVLVSKLTYNIEQVAEATSTAVTTLVQDTLTVIGLLVWMFWVSWKLSLLVIVLGPVIVWLVRYVSQRFRRYSRRIQDSMGDVTRLTEEVITGHRVVKIFGGEEHENRQFETVNERNRYLNVKLAATNAASMPVVQFIAGLGIAAIIFLATSGTVLHSITVGSFVSFLTAALMLMAPLRHLTSVTSPLQKGIAAGESIFELLDADSEDAGGPTPIVRARGDVEFRDIHFAYDAAKGDVLRGVSCKVDAGRTLALVGHSGSGKSTLANLLPRFYDPREGAVLLDGRDLREYRLPDLRRQIALVSQDVTLFNDTLAHNVAYGGLEEADRAAIEAALDAAHALDFVRAMPDGLDTIVGDRGLLLSGGQRQRIAIARALLKDAPILILDEATSALDVTAERHIQQALEALMRERTTLVIAHRLSTIEKADQIVMLDHGRIIETGTHKSLLAAEGAYANLYRMQFREPENEHPSSQPSP